MIEHLVRMAEQVDRERTFGLALGLEKDEVEEVISTWAEVYSHLPLPVPWDRVRTAMILRSNGEDWMP